MQKVAFLPLLTIATSYFSATVSAIPTTQPPPDLPKCLVDCFGTHMPELAHCEDPTYISCICENDGASKFPAIRACISETCEEAIADAVLEILSEDICGSAPPAEGPIVTVTSMVTLPCTTDSPDQPTETVVVPPGPTDEVPPEETEDTPSPPEETDDTPAPPEETDDTPSPPEETDTPPDQTSPPEVPPEATTTGVVPPPGTNTTVSVPDTPTTTEPPVDVPTDDGSAASSLERTMALMGLLGVLTAFIAL